MRAVSVAMFFYISGVLFFLVWAASGNGVWASGYYLWDKTKDLLLVFAIYNLIQKDNSWLVKPVLIYCITRLIWEIVNTITGIGINHPTVVTILFLIITTGVALLLLKDLVKRWRQKY